MLNCVYQIVAKILLVPHYHHLVYYDFLKKYHFKSEKMLQEMLRIGEKYKGFITLKELQNMTLSEYCLLLNAIHNNINEDKKNYE